MRGCELRQALHKGAYVYGLVLPTVIDIRHAVHGKLTECYLRSFGHYGVIGPIRYLPFSPEQPDHSRH